MRPEDLRPGDHVTWNGRRASVTHTVGVKGQRHRWLVGLVFEGVADAAPIQLQVNPDQEIDAG